MSAGGRAPAVRQLFASPASAGPLTVIAGPCVVESAALCRQVADFAAETCAKHGLNYIFKASFDKANRTSLASRRGPGADAALDILARLRADTGLAVLTDIHLPEQAATVGRVVDVLQVPAFLCRQTDLLLAAAATGLPVNIKKGQFLAPEDMLHAVAKVAQSPGAGPVAATERGTSFGYHDLVVDMRGLVIMRQLLDGPVIFDATHSVQRPGGGQGQSHGDRHLAPALARAAVAVGVDGLFCELHPRPDEAWSDGPNSLTFALFDQLCAEAAAVGAALRGLGRRCG